MLKWYGKQVEQQIRADIQARLAVVGKTIQKEARDSMFNNDLRMVGGKIARSSPGEAPYKQTHKLAKSIAVEMLPKMLAVKVGTNVKYGKALELGTRKMRWRPWLIPALVNSIGKIKAIFAKPIGKSGLWGATETDFTMDGVVNVNSSTEVNM